MLPVSTPPVPHTGERALTQRAGLQAPVRCLAPPLTMPAGSEHGPAGVVPSSGDRPMRETPKARQAWADYVALGPDRSLEKLLRRYQTDPSPPTTRLSSLKQWSVQFGWQQRLQDIADAEVAEAEARQAAHIRSIMETGFALAHERVRVLNDLAGTLLEELTAEGSENRRWVSEWKLVGSGENAQLVEIERFNKAEVEQFRLLLDDIAKELGERVRKTELSGPDGGSIDVTVGFSDAERARRVTQLLDSARARRDRPSDPE